MSGRAGQGVATSITPTTPTTSTNSASSSPVVLLRAPDHGSFEDQQPANEGSAARWLDGGLLSGWTPQTLRRQRSAPRRRDITLALTEVVDSRPSDVIAGWLDAQQLVPGHQRPASLKRGTVFWRVAMNRKPVALGALPCTSVSAALGRARRLVREASRLEVSLGYLPGQRDPRWIVHDAGVPLLVGLPQQVLIAAAEPESSLAALIAGATVQRYVHRAGDGR